MPIKHEVSPVPKGCKRIDVTLVIHTYEDVPEDWDEGATRFYIEENHCIGNYLERIQEDERVEAERLGLREGSGICQVCSFASAHVGHIEIGEEGET